MQIIFHITFEKAFSNCSFLQMKNVGPLFSVFVIICIFNNNKSIFAQNDLMALGVLEVLKQHKLRIPEDIALIGADNIVMGRWFHPQLTTVAIDYDQIIALTEKWIVGATGKHAPKEFRHFLNGRLLVRDTFK